MSHENARASHETGAQREQHSHSNESQAEKLLNRLDGVRRTGPGRWVAKCPAHEDRAPSLSLRQCDDGRMLVHCFAGCDVQSILDSIGLEFSDLFPAKRIDHHVPRERALFDARDALRCLSREVLVLLGASAKLLSGQCLSTDDLERLQVCANVILTVKEKANV